MDSHKAIPVNPTKQAIMIAITDAEGEPNLRYIPTTSPGRSLCPKFTSQIYIGGTELSAF
jgi:hypothetical protein